jgi:hypothetical protein
MLTYHEIKSWMDSNIKNHILNGKVNMTRLAEDCAENFNVSTEMGDSEDEELIFDIATEYFNE